MTKEQVDRLTPEQKRIKIAELCGWKWEMVPSDEEMKAAREGTGKYEGAKGYPIGGGSLGGLQYRWWTSPGGVKATPPDYLTDLNAMHEAEKLFCDSWDTQEGAERRSVYLMILCSFSQYPIGAAAHQRACAFLMTLLP